MTEQEKREKAIEEMKKDFCGAFHRYDFILEVE